MKKYLVLLFTCFILSFTFAQASKNEEKIDPKIEKSVTDLAQHLTKESGSEEEKVRAIHSWITNNIAYDYKLIESDKSFKYESATKVLKDKKALCTGYVRLMRDMLDAVGIQAVYVPGYTYAHKEFYKPKVLLDNHAWIAIKIDGNWKMADPTWDAGYIGSLEAEKLREKLDKKNSKIGKKNLKFIEASKDTLAPLNVDSILAVENPTGDVGFIFKPSEDWFLVDESEFLLRHLPANPMWQLRDDIITVPQFLSADSTLKKMLSEDAATSDFNFQARIDTFLNKSFIEQIAFMGADAYDFYPENKRVKAYYYYYFLSIIFEKEIQNEIKEFDLSQTYRLRRMISQTTDSALHYAKLSEKVEKERYKALGGFYKDIDKSSQTNGNYFVKMATKSLGWNDKIIVAIEKKSEKLPSQIEKLSAVDGQYSKPDDLMFKWEGEELPEVVKTIVDSTTAIKTRWENALHIWEERVENSPLKQAYYLVDYNNYLLQRRMVFLGHKSISFNDYIDTVDVIIRLNLDTLTEIYAEDIKEETFSDDAYKIVKELETYQKSTWLEVAKSDLTDQEQTLVIGYVNKVLSHVQSQQLIAAEEALKHNVWMYENLLVVSDAMVRFEKLASDQERLTLDKNEYLVEQAEHEHKREEDLADVIQKKVKIWQDKNK
jgi:hypothetical protein